MFGLPKNTVLERQVIDWRERCSGDSSGHVNSNASLVRSSTSPRHGTEPDVQSLNLHARLRDVNTTRRKIGSRSSNSTYFPTARVATVFFGEPVSLDHEFGVLPALASVALNGIGGDRTGSSTGGYDSCEVVPSGGPSCGQCASPGVSPFEQLAPTSMFFEQPADV